MPYASGAYLLGHLVADPKGKTAGETTIAEMAVAVERYMGKGKDPKVSFFDMTAFGKQAQFCLDYLQKGQAIFAEVTPDQQRWETSEGQKRSRVVFIVNKIMGVSHKKEG